jgi:hypothetical protein
VNIGAATETHVENSQEQHKHSNDLGATPLLLLTQSENAMTVPGPTDDEWKKMPPEQKSACKIFVGVVFVLIAVAIIVKIIAR